MSWSKRTSRSLLYLSSTRLYANASETSETAALPVTTFEPSDLYNLSKLMGESLCLNSGRNGMRIARLSNVVGFDPDSDNFLPALIREALAGTIELRSALNSSKDYVALEDVLAILPRIAVEGLEPIYNVASGRNIRNGDLTKQLEALTGCRVQVAEQAPVQRFPSIRIERLRQEFRFSPFKPLGTPSRSGCRLSPGTRCSGLRQNWRPAMIRIDLEQGWVSEDGGDGEVRHALGSADGFALVSKAWLRAGWDAKYVYSFTWMGRPVIQLPEDMLRIQEVIYADRPTLIIETGVAHGGSLIFYASLFKAMGIPGRVVGIDIEIRPHNRRAIESHELFPYITLLEGSSVAPEIVDQVRALVGAEDRVMVILDSNHSKTHVQAELDAYVPW